MEQVCLGPNGIVDVMKPGGLYIDHTTNSPLLVRRVHDMLATRGVAMLDAPVSGGMEGALTRDLLVVAGGEPAAFERARPLLDAVASPPEDRTHCRIAIISDPPSLDLPRLKRGQPHRNFAV